MDISPTSHQRTLRLNDVPHHSSYSIERCNFPKTKIWETRTSDNSRIQAFLKSREIRSTDILLSDTLKWTSTTQATTEFMQKQSPGQREGRRLSGDLVACRGLNSEKSQILLKVGRDFNLNSSVPIAKLFHNLIFLPSLQNELEIKRSYISSSKLITGEHVVTLDDHNFYYDFTVLFNFPNFLLGNSPSTIANLQTPKMKTE